LERPQGGDGRKLANWLWPEQAFSLLDECTKLDAEFGIYCTMLLYTGERLTEPLKMSCNDLRVAEGFAYVADSKNGEPRPIFLPPYLRETLATHPRGLERGDEPLFKFHKNGHLYSLLKAAAARAEVTLLKGQAFHIFCHTWATWMRRYGGLDTKGLVGTQRWKDRKSADRYEHVVATEEAARAELLPTPKRV
jgi:integrase